MHLARTFDYFSGMRLKVMSEAQVVIRRVWMLYKNNKNYFKQQNAAKQAQSMIKQLVE
jgi:hypothetical protein